jgi:DNA-3-methyladenine glycosylase
MTIRNRIVFGPAGYAHVFFIYGKHFCVNALTGNEEKEAVLIRTLEPAEGIGLMQARRQTDLITNLCNGPGKLTQTLDITKDENGLSLKDSLPPDMVSRQPAWLYFPGRRRDRADQMPWDIEIRGSAVSVLYQGNRFISRS